MLALLAGCGRLAYSSHAVDAGTRDGDASDASDGAASDAGDDAAGGGAAPCATAALCRPTLLGPIQGNDTDADDSFGWSIAACSHFVVASARGHHHGTVMHSGAVYMLDESATDPGLAQIAEVMPSDITRDDWLGQDVACHGERAVIGRFSDFSGHASREPGAAYVYERRTGVWTEAARLVPSEERLGDLFGTAVDIGGNVVAVGAPYANGNLGAVFLFRADGVGGWPQIARLVARVTSDGGRFGGALAASDSADRVVVGARDDTNEVGGGAGTLYVFETQPDATWLEVARLTVPEAGTGAELGFSVAISGERIVAGAPGASPGGLVEAGAAYVFERRADATWAQVATLESTSPAPGDRFGQVVDVVGDRAIAGAPLRDLGGTDRGSAFLFARQPDGSWAQVADLSLPDGRDGDQLGHSVALTDARAYVSAPGRSSPGVTDVGEVYTFVLGP